MSTMRYVWIAYAAIETNQDLLVSIRVGGGEEPEE